LRGLSQTIRPIKGVGSAGLLQGLKKRRFTAEIVQFATSP
jgi:hypothetical protein